MSKDHKPARKSIIHSVPRAMTPHALLYDAKLSHTARNIMAIILSLNSMEDVTQEWIESTGPESKAAVRKAMHELLAAGYATRVNPKEKGKYIGFIWTFYDTAVPEAERTPFSSLKKS